MNGSVFRYSRIDETLYFGFIGQNGFFIALPEKALIDKDTDLKAKLGSILEAEYREYYTQQRFTYLKQTLSAHLNR